MKSKVLTYNSGLHKSEKNFNRDTIAEYCIDNIDFD